MSETELTFEERILFVPTSREVQEDGSTNVTWHGSLARPLHENEENEIKALCTRACTEEYQITIHHQTHHFVMRESFLSPDMERPLFDTSMRLLALLCIRYPVITDIAGIPVEDWQKHHSSFQDPELYEDIERCWQNFYSITREMYYRGF